MLYPPPPMKRKFEPTAAACGRRGRRAQEEGITWHGRIEEEG